MILSYDGGFSGLLCAISQSLSASDPPLICRNGEELFGGVLVKDESDVAEALAKRFCSLSAAAFRLLKAAWMSEEAIDAAMGHFAYAILTSRDAEEAERRRLDRGDPSVRTVLAAALRVAREYHRLIGILRFRPDESGRLIALCHADHALLPVLSGHFKVRYRAQPWMIIDLKRACLLVSDGESVKLLPVSKESAASIKDQTRLPDDEWTGLWALYYKELCIESRRNEALRRRFLPERYWKYLPELYDGSDGGLQA